MDMDNAIVAHLERQLSAEDLTARHKAGGYALALASVMALTAAAQPAWAQEGMDLAANTSADLSALSLDQLLNIEVTSVSKRPEKLAEAAAAIYVLTGDEIHRHGARNIAEALRMVPGLQVARTDARGYAVSARGFNGSSSDKLQVLLDGRSVYTPLTSAVFWDVLDTYMDDIDRIEVIRGPGATLWGANAVNGVINIITRHSSETLDTRLSGGVGSEDRARAELRTGTRIGESGTARLYIKGAERSAGIKADGSDSDDGSRVLQAGIRSDWEPISGHTLMVSADTYSDRFKVPPSVVSASKQPTDASGTNLLARWTDATRTDSSWTLQTYYDQYRRNVPGTFYERRETLDLDFQQQLQLGTRNTLIYGLGYRGTSDETGEAPGYVIVFSPRDRITRMQSAFIQDQLSLLDGRVVVTAGSKFEHNDFTGFEIQPSLRVGWQVAPEIFTWSSVSRAVRTPNRLNSDIAIFCPPPAGFPGVCGPGLFPIGNPNVASEKLIAYEWGLRLWNERGVSLDLATFYNTYTSLLSTEKPPGSPIGRYDNKMRGSSYGAELAADWRPRNNLDVKASYSYLRLDVTPDAGSTDTTTEASREGADPRHQAGIRILYQPADQWTMSSFLRYVGGLHAYSIPAYTELNLRVAYQLKPGLELSIAGQNLLAPRHPEFGAATSRSETQRSVLFGVNWTLP